MDKARIQSWSIRTILINIFLVFLFSWIRTIIHSSISKSNPPAHNKLNWASQGNSFLGPKSIKIWVWSSLKLHGSLFLRLSSKIFTLVLVHNRASPNPRHAKDLPKYLVACPLEELLVNTLPSTMLSALHFLNPWRLNQQPYPSLPLPYCPSLLF
mgnify:CR=1 FL=1